MIEGRRGHANEAERIAAFADGELSEGAARAVERHLRRCARCRRELLVQRYLWWALGRERIAAAPAGLRRRVERIGGRLSSEASDGAAHPR